MITAALSYVLMPSNFFFFFKIVLSFAFHINYKINLLISTKKPLCMIFDDITLILWINLRRPTS